MRRSSSVAEFCLRRPVAVGMLTLSSLVLGVIAFFQIPVQLMPTGYDFPYLWLWIPYEHSSPQEMERAVVRPVEDALETLPGLRSLESSAGTEEAEFELEFDQSVDMDEAYSAVVDRLDRAMPDLPEDIERYFVYRYNPADEPIMWAAVAAPPELADPGRLMEQHVLRALERVPGVARVEHHGAAAVRLWVDFDKDRVREHGVNLYEVVSRLSRDNQSVAAGKIEEDGRIVFIRSVGTWDDADAVRSLPIAPGIVLGDIADIELARPAPTSIHRVNGGDAASIDIYKESDANTVLVCEGLQAAFDELGRNPQLQGFTFHRFFDQGALIQDSLNNLWEAAWQGGALAILVLIFFLRKFRITLVIGLAIPLSFLLVLAAMYVRGETLNLLSLMGLMLSVGNAVDNSIVVVESIMARRELGDSPRTAAIRGTAEVGLAITLSTLTNVVVFLPVVLMSDDARFSFMMGALAMPVVWCSFASLAVAVVVVPLLMVLFGAAEPTVSGRISDWVARQYARLLDATLRRRPAAVVAIFLIFGSIAWPMGHLQETDEIQGGIVDFNISMQFPRNFTLAEIDAALRKMEEAVTAKKEAWGIRSIRARRWGGSERGRVMAFLGPREADMPDREQILKELPKILPEIPGVESWVGWRRGEGAGNSVDIALFGDDSETLEELGEEVVSRLKGLPGVVGVEAEVGEDGADELHVRIDRERAARLGLSTEVLARSVAFGFRGTSLRPLRDGGDEIPVQAGFRLEDRHHVRELLDFEVAGTMGSVPLGAVANTKFDRGFGRIGRTDRKTTLQVRIDLSGKDLGAVKTQIGTALADLALPRGYSWTPGDRFERMEEQDRARQFALLMSVAYVFLLMGMLFESFWLPLAVLLSIPFAFLGVYWALYLTGTPFEVMSGIGLVVLVGVVVNNAIVLVDRIQQNRDAGQPRHEAIVNAGRERLRPILMTASTTIVGLLPMALGDAAVVGIPYDPMGKSLMGGMIASTALTLVVVPLFYSFFDDLRLTLSAVLRWGRGAVTAGLAIVLLLSPESALAEPNGDTLSSDVETIERLGSLPDDAPVLSLAEALARAVQKNLGVAIRSRELEAARSRARAADAPWIPYLMGNLRIHPWKSERYFDQYASWERRSGQDGSYTVGVGPNLFTGTRLSLTWSQGLYDQVTTYDPEVKVDNPFDPDQPFEILVNNEYRTRWAAIGITLNQSLLQGISPAYNLAPRNRARLAAGGKEIQYRKKMAEVAADTIRGYWDLVSALRLVEIARIDVRLAEDQRAATRARIGAGDLAEVELLRVDETALTRAAELLEAERLAQETQERLAGLVGADGADPLRLAAVRPVDDVRLELPAREAGPSIEVALGHNPDLQLLALGLEDGRIERDRARHELLPDLNLEATLSLNGSGFESQEAADDVFRQRYPDFEVGLNFTIPLPDLAAIEGTRAAEWDLEVADRTQDEGQVSVEAAIRSAVRGITSFDRQVGVAVARVALAARSVDAAEATYRAGRNTLSDVLLAHKNLKDARRAEVLSRVSSQKARIELELLRGTLLEVLGIEERAH